MKDLVLLGLACLLVACGDSSGSGAGGNGGSGAGGSNAGGSPAEGGSPSEGGNPSEGGAPLGGGGAGGGSACPTDTSEPNDSFNFPAFLNDASMGIACGGNAVSGGGVLPDTTDADFIKIYTDSVVCEAGAPSVDLTIDGPLDICIYTQDCDEGPSIFGCPDGTTLQTNEDELLTGCCGTMEQSGTLRITDFVACTNFNTQIYVVLDNSDPTLDCNVYQLSVSL